MSATGFPPTAPTQAKQARVASHARSSPLLSPAPAAANDTRSATRSPWLTGSDNISSQTSVPATTLRQWRDFSPSLNKRVSGKSESSSLESSSAEFDGDISIVAPLGQEENTDLYSIKSFPISVSTASKDNQQTFPDTASDSNSTYVIDKQKPLRLELLNLTNSSSSEESLLTGLLPSATVSTRPLLKNSHLTYPKHLSQEQLPLRRSQGEVKQAQRRDKSHSAPTTLLPVFQRQQDSQSSYILKDKQSPVLNQTTSHRLLQQRVHKGKQKLSEVTSDRESPIRSTATTSSNCPPRMATSLEDITSLRLWKGIVAEFVGTLLLTLVGCGSCINLRGDTNVTSPVVQIALCFGLSVATVVWAIAHVSGGHVNPAVTCAMLATRKISLVKAVLFIVFQLVGAVVGAGILYGLTPPKYIGNLGCTLISDKLTPAQALGVELFVTFVLVFTVFASCDGKRKDLNGSAPLTIGLSVTMCHLWAIDYTGSSMNTARSFGPALIKGNWDGHWVYWAGPIIGGVVAGLLYEHLFAVNASITKAKACLLTSDYDDEKYRAKKLKVRIIEEENDLDSPAELVDNGSYPLTEKDSAA